MICRHCQREIADVLGTFRDASFLSFCGLGDYKHQPEMLVFGYQQILVTPHDPADASKAAALEAVLNGPLKHGLINKVEEELLRLKRQQLHRKDQAVIESTPSDDPSALAKAFVKTQKIRGQRAVPGLTSKNIIRP